MKKTTAKKELPAESKPVNKKLVVNKNNHDLFVVGMGASAGGLDALKLFFDNLTPVSGLAFVIVQHLAPTHKSLLGELLSQHTKMKVFEITDGVKVKENCVYIIPPNRELRIAEGTLQLNEPEEGRGRRPIDIFFHSLAEDQKDKAIGIVLSGTGTEGALGLREIKAEGGLTLVQDPKSAQFDGMPLSAIAGKTADYILTPEKMPAHLLQYIYHRKVHPLELKSALTVAIEQQLMKICLIIRNQTGYDFSNYKTNTIVRRITKRIAFNQLDSIDDYIEFLKKDVVEVENLYKDFLIGVTSFFRDKDVFNSIERNAIPYLFEKRDQQMEIRVWVCGCSTGEEAYSLAILFREALEKNKLFVKVLIFASDIDKDAIEIARGGTYPESIMADITPERLSKYFMRKENVYQLKKEIREMVVFAYHNVIKDPPFSRMDMITCRNMLIYMNNELQKKIIPLFHYSLKNDGLLVLGTSESIGEHERTGLFADFDARNKIFSKKQDIVVRKTSAGYELPNAKQAQVVPVAVQHPDLSKKVNMASIIEKYLLDHYLPPSAIIDKNNDVLYFSGNTGLYLEPAAGEAKLNILKMAKLGLKIPLEAAIKQVRAGSKEVLTTGVNIKVNNYFKTINLIVKQVQVKDTALGALMVIFEPSEILVKDDTIKKKFKSEKRSPGVGDLEKELKITQEHLQSAINELDLSRENLQTTNEEYQSSNEELQSTNEELETSREELQSLNEELITVNNELQDKITQLSEANDDLNNLLRSIEVATIFLDRDLKIKRFTPTATKIFNLIPSDIDRPVTHLTANILYSELAADVKEALKTLSVKAADVQATDGTWYQMRIIPYRSGENIIEGVLVTFVDITGQKLVAENLKKTNEHLNLIMENLPAVPYTCVALPDLKFSFVGNSAEKVTGFMPDQFINNKNFWINRVHPDDKAKMLLAFSAIAKKGRMEYPFRWKCADGKFKNFVNFIRYAVAANGEKSYIVGVWQEVTNPKQIKAIVNS